MNGNSDSRHVRLRHVRAARDWKQAVPGSGGAADAVIDAACVKMGKSRAELALVGVQ
jgi:hypothetical protein